MKELFEAVRAGDLARVQALVDADPSLAIFAAAILGDLRAWKNCCREIARWCLRSAPTAGRRCIWLRFLERARLCVCC
jgi:hypothetical protein